MEITTGKLLDVAVTYPPGRTAGSAQAQQAKTEAGARPEDSTTNANTKEEDINKDKLSEVTDELNKFMQIINADLRFAMHEKTQRLMVQVVDTKEQKVLKEFPPHELLDTIAKIRDFVGVLLDKKV
ncbi:hypothetical protein SCACP_31570 [Sporomusa carbonis]|uniref:flagellar protein FlaG n=1 Tax=Sporomusa carbonis TaxID=3076075 RepID=UPI003A6A6759